MCLNRINKKKIQLISVPSDDSEPDASELVPEDDIEGGDGKVKSTDKKIKRKTKKKKDNDLGSR